MSRRRKHEEHENHERWLITYSDLITLLMIFFVIMYAMSSVDQKKFTALQQSLALAMHQSDQIPLDGMGSTSLVQAASATDTGDNPTPHPSTVVTDQNQQALDHLAQQVNQYIKDHHLAGNVTVVDEKPGVRITLRDVVLFDTGEAVVKPAAEKLLGGLVPFFNQVQNPIVIEGHTDNQPIHTSEYPTNWELSSARAIDVVRFLVAQGVAPERLAGVGYGQYHPIAPNDTPQHRQMNRRVNIFILRDNNDLSAIETQ